MTWRDLLSVLQASHAFSRWGRSLLLSAMVGILAGCVAAGLEWGLDLGSRHLVGRFTYLGGSELLPLNLGILFFPVIGGLLSGILALLFKVPPYPQGTESLTRAFHFDNGNLPLKNPLVKAIAAVLNMSFGASVGPEGPIAGLSAAIGSKIGHIFKLTIRERRIFLIAGCAAGVGAIFRCPLGGALFATSILYKEPEFEHASMMPAFVASVIGYSTFMSFWGYGEPFLSGTSSLAFTHPSELFPYTLLGILCGLVAIFLSLSFTYVRAVVSRRLPRSLVLAPALGGLAVGVLASIFPQVMDGQYRFIQNALDPAFFSADGVHWIKWSAILAAILMAKCIATALSVGSGGAGGVLGPSVFIGGVTGAMLGACLEAAFPGSFPEGLRQALIPVGMTGVLSGVMRIPLASMVMVMEMTGTYGLIVPLMLVSVSAYIIGRRYGINTEQVASASQSPAHAGDAILHFLETTSVDALMVREWPQIVSPSDPLNTIIEAIIPGTRPKFVVTENNQVRGIIGAKELRAVVSIDDLPTVAIAADIMECRVYHIAPEESLYHALSLFQKYNISSLPVIAPKHEIFLGMLERQDILTALDVYFETMRRQLFSEHQHIQLIESDDPLRLFRLNTLPKSRELIQKIPVPPAIVGQSLRSSNFRNDYRLEVMAIEAWEGGIIAPADPDYTLMKHDILVVIKKEPNSCA